VQLMQKFVPRKCVGILRDKRTQSTPLDPKHMFWCILYSLGAFWTILLPYETNFKTGRTGAINAKVRAVKFCWNLSQQTHLSTPLDPKHMFSCISYSLGAFGTILLPHETNFKMGRTGQLMQKFVPRSRVVIFHNERTRSTPLDPKLKFWCVSYSLGALGIILFPYETRFKTGRTGAINAKLRATKVCRNFSQRMHPIHSIGA
jgi:hypothetical protein